MTRSTVSRLSDKRLLSTLTDLTRNERDLTVEILLHLGEVEQRKLHFKLGYGSLFEYCTKRLRYSDSAAGRRVQAARSLRRFPEIGDMLRQGELSLLTLSLVAGILTEETKFAVLSSIRGKSKREVERIVSRHRPVTSIRDRIRPVCIRVPHGPLCPPTQLTPTGGSDSAEPGSVDPDDELPARSALKPTTVPRSPLDTVLEAHVIQFAAGSDFVSKLEQMRALLSHTKPRATLEEIFGVAMEAYLDKHSPERRAKRRKARARKARSNGNGKTGAKPSGQSKEAGPATTVEKLSKSQGESRGAPPRTRRIPAAVRDDVFARDRGQCTYISAVGKRCKSKHNLQIDHVVPVARGGSNDPSNLRLLCAYHNRLEAERILGFDPEKRRSGKAKIEPPPTPTGGSEPGSPPGTPGGS